jgi:hypothetical protein
VQNRQQAAEAQLAQLEVEKTDTDAKIEAGDIDPELHQKQVLINALHTIYTLSIPILVYTVYTQC